MLIWRLISSNGPDRQAAILHAGMPKSLRCGVLRCRPGARYEDWGSLAKRPRVPPTGSHKGYSVNFLVERGGRLIQGESRSVSALMTAIRRPSRLLIAEVAWAMLAV